MKRHLIALTLTLAACFGIQSIALHLNGGHTVKSESNYFSSIARIQTESRKKADIMLLGSSLTGRLADRAQAPPQVANLGCDGGSAVITLRAMDHGLLPAAPLLIIEANTLGFGIENRGSDISNAIASRWFQIGSEVPNLGATARPSAFFYSWLMARKLAAPEKTHLTLGLQTQPMRLLPAEREELNADEKHLIEDLAGILARLHARGSRILIVKFPAGDLNDAILANIPTALAARTGFPYWDLNQGLAAGTVAYTDGRHLDGSSAQKLINTLLDYTGLP